MHSRYQERLGPLEALASRLRVAGVPCAIVRRVPNTAPTVPDDALIPALDVARGWRTVKVLYWAGVPYFSYPYLSGGRWPVDEGGTDRLASHIVMQYTDAKAHGEVDDRRM